MFLVLFLLIPVVFASFVDLRLKRLFEEKGNANKVVPVLVTFHLAASPDGVDGDSDGIYGSDFESISRSRDILGYTVYDKAKTQSELIRCEEVLEIHWILPFKANELCYKEKKRLSKPRKIQTEWNIQYVGAEAVWKKYSHGEKTIFASADTGVDWRHPALTQNYAGRVWSKGLPQVSHDYAWWDSIEQENGDLPSSCPPNSQEPCDDKGHGTHTTSTAVGQFGIGMAPNAIWVACRNMRDGVGSTKTYITCLNFFLAPTDLQGENPDPKKRPHVIDNSYGCPESEGCARWALHNAIETLIRAHVFLAASAGNEGPSCRSIKSPPSFEPLIVTVGATDFKSDKIASFSSRGPIDFMSPKGRTIQKPDVVAPGRLINGAHLGNGTAILSGTSMACPHVAGAALLVMSACPQFLSRPRDLAKLLKKTARRLPISNLSLLCGHDTPNRVPNNVYGHGMLAVDQAVAQCVGNLFYTPPCIATTNE